MTAITAIKQPDPLDRLRYYYHNARAVALLYVLVFYSHPVTAKCLSKILETDRETLTLDLRFLYNEGLAMRSSPRSGWFITDSGMRLIQGVKPEKPAQLVKESSSSYSRENRFQKEEEDLRTELTRESRVNLPPEIQEALEECQFTMNQRVLKMARLNHITPDYIRRTLESFTDQEKYMPEWCGALLVALESPPSKKENHCTCRVKGLHECIYCRRKYAESWNNL